MNCSSLLNNNLLKQSLIESFENNFNENNFILFNNHSEWIEGLNQWFYHENLFFIHLKMKINSSIYFDEDLRFYLPKKEIQFNLNSNQQQFKKFISIKTNCLFSLKRKKKKRKENFSFI